MQHDSAVERIQKLTVGERGLAYLAEHKGKRFTQTSVARAIGANYLVLRRHQEFLSAWREHHAPPSAGSRGVTYLAQHPGERLTITAVAKAIGANHSTLGRHKGFMAAWRAHHVLLTPGARAMAYVTEHKGERISLAKVAREIRVSRRTLQRDETFMVAWRVRHGFRLKKLSALSKFAESYILHKLVKANSADQIRYAVKAFELFLERPPRLSDLNEEMVTGFISWRLQHKAPKTAKRERGTLIALWTFAAKKKLVTAAPIDVPRGKLVQRNPVAWKLTEIERILKACDTLEGRMRSESDPKRGRFVQTPYTGPLRSEWWASLILLIYDTATRRGAALQIAPTDIDLEAGFVVLRGDVAKTHLEQVLPLSPQTVGAIRRIYDPKAARVWSWNGSLSELNTELGRILKKAGLPNDRFHKFHAIRRTTATLAAAAGRRDLAQSTLGHTTPTMTDGYIDKRALPIESAANVLPRPAWGDSTPQTSPERPSVAVADVLMNLPPDALEALVKLAKTLAAAGKAPA